MEKESAKPKKVILLLAGGIALCLVFAVLYLMLGGHLKPAAEAVGSSVQQTQTQTTVVTDTTPPVITGAEDKTYIVGQTVAYRSGVTAEDPEEGAVNLNLDASAVNATQSGTYPVTYWAEDSAGNRTEVTIQVTFQEAEEEEQTTAPADDGSESSETEVPKYYALAQSIYKKIIKEGMTEEQKIKAIWKWSRRKISFTGRSDKSDWKKGAVVGFTKLRGDCFNYYATSKALLEVAGIPTMDIQKIRMKGRSDHYWLLVFHEGSWWHFDACPRTGAGKNTFCLYTDQQMLAFSEKHEDCFDFDLRLYPRTPGTIDDKYLIRFYPSWYDSEGNRLQDANGNLAGTPNYNPAAEPPETTETIQETTQETTQATTNVQQ